MKEVEKLQPRAFTRFCMSIGAVPSSYIAGLTIEEQLLWFCSYLEKEVIPVVNNNSEVVEELKYFVEHYFDNLDVQEEINNKLDEMAESGELEELIASYITNKIQRTYNNNAELEADDGLEAGMIVKTLGKLAANDGGGCEYVVSDTAPSALPNTTNNNSLDNFYLTLQNDLYAIPKNNINNDYYDEITLTSERIDDTDCYFTTIPYQDNDGNEIELYVKNNSGMEISDYARLHKTTLSINATLSVENPETGLYENASVISNGEIIRDHMNPPDFLEDHYKFIGIKANREVVDFQANSTTAEAMLAQGVKEAWLCFGQLVDNGTITDYAQDTSDEIMGKLYPRQCLGIKNDKTVIILTCDGRTVHDRGLTGAEAAQILLNKGCANVYNLDGGGSTNTVYKGSRINRYIDENGMKERHIVYCLNAKKPTTNANIDNSYNNIGEEKERIIKQLLPTIPRIIYENTPDLDDYTTDYGFHYVTNSTNHPSDSTAYGYVLNIPIASNDNESYGKYCKQFFFSRDDSKYWRRTLNNETWSEWIQCGVQFGCEVAVTTSQAMGAGTTYKVVELATKGDYFPNYFTLDTTNDRIVTSRACGVNIQALFNVDCQLDGTFTIRGRKNGSNILTAQISCKAGNKYQIVFQKAQSLAANDYIDFTCNAGTNTGNVNTISSGMIQVTQVVVN